jgi:hypothetical protein
VNVHCLVQIDIDAYEREADESVFANIVTCAKFSDIFAHTLHDHAVFTPITCVYVDYDNEKPSTTDVSTNTDRSFSTRVFMGNLMAPNMVPQCAPEVNVCTDANRTTCHLVIDGVCTVDACYVQSRRMCVSTRARRTPLACVRVRALCTMLLYVHFAQYGYCRWRRAHRPSACRLHTAAATVGHWLQSYCIHVVRTT